MWLNNRALRELRGFDFSRIVIPPELLAIFRGGLVVDEDCVFLLSLVSRKGRVALDSFSDRTGYECFVNSFHVDDYVDSDYMCVSVFLVKELFSCWSEQGIEAVVRVIVSGDELGAVFRFHLIREGEDWISEDLESYEEAVIVIDSSEKWTDLFSLL